MSRQLRIEFPGAVYHVTSRGDRREPIYRDDTDRQAQLDILAQAMDRFDAQVLAYCQMGNHFHLVLHTRSANLSRLMRHHNGVHARAFNRRRGFVGRNPVLADLGPQPADGSRAWQSLQPARPGKTERAVDSQNDASPVTFQRLLTSPCLSSLP